MNCNQYDYDLYPNVTTTFCELFPFGKIRKYDECISYKWFLKKMGKYDKDRMKFIGFGKIYSIDGYIQRGHELYFFFEYFNK